MIASLFGCGKHSDADGPGVELSVTAPAESGTEAEEIASVVFYSETEQPKDGETPRELSPAENLTRIAWTLKHESDYSATAYGTVRTKVAFITYKQEVWTYKDFKDGVMLLEDITKSSLVNSAWQTCYADGKAFVRGPASDSAGKWNGKDTEWDENEPQRYTEEEYITGFGLFGTDLSVYLLNGSTVSGFSDVADNGDGTFTMTVYPDLTEATSYYKVRMKNMGDLSEYPSFNSIAITYTFDSGWRLLAAHTEELYSVKFGIISSDDCRAVTDCAYAYGNADISDYEFFAQYAK